MMGEPFFHGKISLRFSESAGCYSRYSISQGGLMKPVRLLIVNFALLWPMLIEPCVAQQRVSKESLPVKEDERPAQYRSPVEDLRERERQLVQQPRLPLLHTLVRMTAECYNHPSSPLLKDVGRFEVPKERYGEILLPFAQAELDPQPQQEYCELGTVLLSFRGGGNLRIVWFWTGRETRLRFSYAGLRYIATRGPLASDQALSLDALVRKIHAEARAATAATAEAKQDTRPGAPALPAIEDIEAISAEAYSNVLWPGIKDIPPFDVPKERFADVLEPFSKESHRDEHLRRGTELGSLRLTLKGGRTRRICWFWMGHKGRMVFSYSGMRYMTVGTTFETDETLEYDGRIRIMKQELDAANETQRAAEKGSHRRGM
jgi:hypothetical protein